MASESWQASNFSFATAVVTDSPGLQAAIAARMIANGWTNPIAGTYKSPHATAWCEAIFTQPSSTKLEIRISDYLGVNVSRRVGNVANPSTWNIHVNTFGLVVWDSTGSGWLFGGILDHFPQDYSSHTLDSYLGGYHTTSDVTEDTLDQFFTKGYAGFDKTRPKVHFGLASFGVAAARNSSGIRRDWPLMVWTSSAASQSSYAGRAHHIVVVDGGQVKDALIPVATDVDTIKQYKVTGILGGYGAPVRKLAVRVGA